MSKGMTVKQLHKRLEEIVASGYGNAMVLVETQRFNPPKVRAVDYKYTYIGPSAYDQATYGQTKEPGKTILL